MICSTCHTQNRNEARFCRVCGATLARMCQNGHPITHDARFCDECGAPVVEIATQDAPSVWSPPEAPSAERRLVSILFADLVGFTTLSESRDVEEVRDLLTRYFDTCSRLISLYGGTVEKFIGDAVMAVWGTPVAHEDDAERAVRTALDLTAAVGALGQEVGAPALKARVGVLTGEAAVTLSAQGQGMVAGDPVNTASRIQAAAAPGTVLVGEATKRATNVAIAYEEGGVHRLKGKAEPISLWRALRVVGGRGGAGRSTGLEPPFVGRDRELGMVKELFHRTAEEGRAHLVSVVGIAGIGKSRLSWELFKYIDGLADDILWHRGRCLPYGEGVTYWSLAEMARMRAGITEGEDPATALPKLREAIRAQMPDPDEERWAEPRLAQLLGLEERAAQDREDLFAAWRLFFERMADQTPTVMVFEDLQWADPSMLDFIQYLLDWSRNHALFVLTLSRPELADRRPDWGAGRKNFTPLYLEAMPPSSMEELLVGFVPGLPTELRRQILERTAGVPLYAVETVRMLLDRGILVREGEGFRTTGTVESLAVPESLHALIAARLDGLVPAERRLVQEASVLGKTFPKGALSALSDLDDEHLEQILLALCRKEVLTLEADPRSPERGQYGFLQDLTKRVAYETLSKRERKALHLAGAAYLEKTWGADNEEIVEVVAAHYVESYRSDPDGPDAPELKEKSSETLRRAGERAASFAAIEEARRYFEQAAGLTEVPLTRAALHERAGQMGWAGGRLDKARAHYERAIAMFETEDRTHSAARVSGRLGEVIWAEGHIDQGAERIERSLDVLRDESDADVAWLTAQLGRFLFFMGRPDRAAERIEQALHYAESLGLPGILSEALNTKALILTTAKGRPEEGLALLRHSLAVAVNNDVPSAAQRAYYNLSNLLYYRDQHEEALDYAAAGLELARRVGEREWEWQFMANTVSVLYWSGRWDEALAMAADIPRLEEIPAARFASVELLLSLPPLLTARGRPGEARAILDSFAIFGESPDEQELASYGAARAVVLRADGDLAGALALANEVIARRSALGGSFAGIKIAYVEAAEAAMGLKDRGTARQLVDELDALAEGETTPYMRAQAHRLQAMLDGSEGDGASSERSFAQATSLFRKVNVPFWLAVTLLDHGCFLAGRGRGPEAGPLLNEAAEIFRGLSAHPWIDRVSAMLPRQASAVETSLN